MNRLLIAFAILTILVPPAFAQDTVRVSAGWNIIGSVAGGTIPEVLATEPPGIITTSMYGYAPGAGYLEADTLHRGVGYWVKVSADGNIIFNSAGGSDCGVKTVEYEGRIYRTEPIGGGCWLDRNLNAGTMVAGTAAQSDNGTLEKYCYDDDTLYCVAYGGLYQWDEAMQYVTTSGARGMCPDGWHIPTLPEMQSLSTAVGGDANALKDLGEGSGGGVGTNSTGFAGLLAGIRLGAGIFSLFGDYATVWSSSEAAVTTDAMVMYLSQVSDNVQYGDEAKAYGFSVRCIED